MNVNEASRLVSPREALGNIYCHLIEDKKVFDTSTADAVFHLLQNDKHPLDIASPTKCTTPSQPEFLMFFC